MQAQRKFSSDLSRQKSSKGAAGNYTVLETGEIASETPRRFFPLQFLCVYGSCVVQTLPSNHMISKAEP